MPKLADFRLITGIEHNATFYVSYHVKVGDRLNLQIRESNGDSLGTVSFTIEESDEN